MKVQFIKGRKAGQVVDVPHRRAFYWKLLGLVVEVVEFIKEAKERKSKKDEPTELTATEVIAQIKEATSLSELNKLVKGEERKTVLAAYEKKHAELKGG